jgi:carbamoyl-phosphate synthase large subunit
VEIDQMLQQINLHTEESIKRKVIRYAKKYGFSDGQIARAMKTDTPTIRRLRWKYDIMPVTKQIDTLAAEWPASTNYLYLTYGGEYDDFNYEVDNKCRKDACKKKIIVLGSGVYRIGSSVEFDWGCVNMAIALKKQGVDEVIMINYNPETVSTDYDMSDKLYFEELSGERVLDICYKERADGIVVSVAGQIGNNLTQKFTKYEHAFRAIGIKILGTAGNNIDKAENRMKFGQVMDQLKIKQPEWAELRTIDEAVKFANKVQFPVLVRPSYVLSGAAMRVAYNEEELREFLELAASVSKDNPVVITKFFTDAREIECDGVSDGETVFIGAVVEHIENAGVHSGDATMSIPAPTLQYRIWEKIQALSERIALALDVIGPFNIQYLVRRNEIYVIEMNLRSSRSMPYVSKTRGVNLIRLAAETILGHKIDPRLKTLPLGNYACTKVPQFSFMRLEDADPILGVEMMSTGEVACIGENIPDALIKSLIAAEFKIPMEKGNIMITVAGDELKEQIVPLAKKLYQMGYSIFATIKTAAVLEKNGIQTTVLNKIREPESKPNLLDYIMDRKIDMVINIPIPKKIVKNELILNDEYKLRRKAIEFGIPVVTNLQLADAIIDALEELKLNGINNFEEYHKNIKILSLNEYHDQLKEIYW